MSLKNIKFNIISSDNNYEYNGVANILRDIITFKDKDSYVIDKTTQRIVKNTNEIVLDLKLKKIYLEEYKYSMDIIINKAIFDNSIDIEYVLGDNIIKIRMIEVD
jgi:hypothetical protein